MTEQTVPKLTGVYQQKAYQGGYWVAVWVWNKTHLNHVQMPNKNMTREEAVEYAQSTKPSQW